MGITPARAGKTFGRSWQFAGRRDHPRSCGKDRQSLRLPAGRPGSPPLVRERPIQGAIELIGGRITPARAGKTLRARQQVAPKWDHPRSCGKDAMKMMLFQRNGGSPPLVRERQIRGLTARRKAGITPARAGKTRITPGDEFIAEDHPRSCGKDNIMKCIMTMYSGSPPLVRERHPDGIADEVGVGITPARAGKTRNLQLARCNAQDHPRSCGKDPTPSSAELPFLGSPPLVRERPAGIKLQANCAGITPARAGKTLVELLFWILP